MSQVGRPGFKCWPWLPRCVALEKQPELSEAQFPRSRDANSSFLCEWDELQLGQCPARSKHSSAAILTASNTITTANAAVTARTTATKARMVVTRVRSVWARCQDPHLTALFSTGLKMGSSWFLNQLEWYVTFMHFFRGKIHSCHHGPEGVSDTQTVKPHPSQV